MFYMSSCTSYMFIYKCANPCLYIMYSMHKYTCKFLTCETSVKVQVHCKNGDNNSIYFIGQCVN